MWLEEEEEEEGEEEDDLAFVGGASLEARTPKIQNGGFVLPKNHKLKVRFEKKGHITLTQS